jgi:NitT/TauT family transport system substrate-binding protein
MLVAAAALGSFAAPARSQTPEPLRIGTFAVENAMQPVYAKDVGFFSRNGIDADVQLLPGSSAIVAAVISNAIDIGYAALDVVAAIHARNVPIAVVAPGGEYRSPATLRDAAIMVPAGSAIYRAKDLDGKTVGANSLHSLSDAVPRLWVDQNGGDSTTLKFVELPFAAMPAAFAANRIDAALVSEPFLSVAAAGARALVYGYDCIAKHFLFGAYVTTPQWAADHPDVLIRFRSAMHQAAVWADGNQAKSGELLAAYTKIDPTVIARMTRARFAEELTPDLMQPLIDVSAKFNGFSTFPAQELIALR